MTQIDQRSCHEALPLDLLEDHIEKALRLILGDPWDHSHWGGELNDLMTCYVHHKGQQLRAAFLLKGRGAKGRMYAGVEKRGDQINRLTEADADAYFIVHVADVDSRTFDDLRDHSESAARRQGEDVYYCVIDGCELARILKAHDLPLTSEPTNGS